VSPLRDKKPQNRPLRKIKYWQVCAARNAAGNETKCKWYSWATVCKMVCPMLSDGCLFFLPVTLVYCGQTAGWIKMPLGREVGLSPGDIVLDGDPAPPCPGKRGTAAPHFSADVYCGQTAGWIKMPLSMEVGLGPGHIASYDDPAPPPPKGHSLQFSAHVYCGQTAGWIKMPLGMEVSFGPGHIVLDGDPAPPAQKGTDPQFSAHVCCCQMAG